MTYLELKRRELKMSQRKLGEVASVDASYICAAEKWGNRPYRNQMIRIADALGWNNDDPYSLLEEVDTSSILK